MTRRRQGEVDRAKARAAAFGYTQGHSDAANGWALGFDRLSDEAQHEVGRTGLDPSSRETIHERIEAEYARHVPVFHLSAARLGDTIPSRNHHMFSCAATECPHYWPCPTWHLLRRLVGDMTGRGGTYTLQMAQRAEEATHG